MKYNFTLNFEKCESEAQKTRLTEAVHKLEKFIGKKADEVQIIAPYDSNESLIFFKNKIEVLRISARDDGVDGAFLIIK